MNASVVSETEKPKAFIHWVSSPIEIEVYTYNIQYTYIRLLYEYFKEKTGDTDSRYLNCSLSLLFFFDQSVHIHRKISVR